MLKDANLDWRVLVQDKNPTVNSIFECFFVLIELGPNKPSHLLCTARLHELSSKLGLAASASLLKKAERLRETLPLMSGLFGKWMDKDVTQESWTQLLAAFNTSQEAKRIIDLATAYEEALLGRSRRECMKLSVMTTNLISHRLLTDPIASFLKEARLSPSDSDPAEYVDITVTATEPYTVLDEILAGKTGHDLLLVYCDDQQLRSGNYIESYEKIDFPLHRCLITPRGWLPLSTGGIPLKDLLSRADLTWLKEIRLSRTYHAEQIMPGPFWLEAQHASSHGIDIRRTTPEVHAMVRANAAVGFSHIEFLNEIDEKYLDFYELFEPENKTFFGKSKLVLFARHPDNSKRGLLLRNLRDKVVRQLEQMNGGYEFSKQLKTLLSQFRFTYHTVIAFERDGGKEKARNEWWRGTLELSVTPGLYVKGNIHLFGDESCPIAEDRDPSDFGFVGRCVQFDPSASQTRPSFGAGAYQIILRGFELPGEREHFGANFMLELEQDKDGKLKFVKGFNDYIIGIWTGRQGQETHPPRPDMGVLIFHRNDKLNLEDLNSIRNAYFEANHLLMFSKIPKTVFGTPDA